MARSGGEVLWAFRRCEKGSRGAQCARGAQGANTSSTSSTSTTSSSVYGEGGIRTLGRAFRPYNGLANRRLQPLGHLTPRLASLHRGGPRRTRRLFIIGRASG